MPHLPAKSSRCALLAGGGTQRHVWHMHSTALLAYCCLLPLQILSSPDYAFTALLARRPNAVSQGSICVITQYTCRRLPAS